MWSAVRFSRDQSYWHINDDTIQINIFGKEILIPINDISFLKNHIRSGGNLMVFHKRGKSSAVRIWRNKIFAKNDQFDDLIQKIKDLEIDIVIG